MSDTTSHESFIFWRPEANQRGTFNIVITCFGTLGICLWSSLHLDIHPRSSIFKSNLPEKLAWMLTGFLLPEVLIFLAFQQRRRAGRIKEKVNSHFEPEKPCPWYRGWFQLNASAYIEERDEEQSLVNDSSGSLDLPLVETQEDSDVQSLAVTNTDPGVKPEVTLPIEKYKAGRRYWTLVHAFYAGMGGYAIWDSKGELRILESSFIEYLLEHNPEFVPDIPEETILDRSKADVLAKALLFTQVGWFCVSCFNRLAQHFPLTLLEVSTLSHALCSMTVYILWWDKPLNIQEPLVISCPTMPEAHLRRRGVIVFDSFEIHMSSIDADWPLLFLLLVITLVYGAPHLLAWNSIFATRTERLLWRIASCVVSIFPVCYIAIGLSIFRYFDSCRQYYERYSKDYNLPLAAEIAGGLILGVFCSVIGYAYFASSVYIIAESLRQLFYLPPAAYQTPVWSNYFPHFS